MIRTLFAISVLVVVAVVEIGRTPDSLRSVTSGSLTITYPGDISSKTATEAVRILSESELFGGDSTFELPLVREGDFAVLEIPIVIAEVTPEIRDACATYARVLTDLGGTEQVAIRLTHNGSQLETVQPVRILGDRIFEYENDFIFHSANLEASQLRAMAPVLKERGFLSGVHSVITLAKLDHEFALEINLAQAPSTPEILEAQSEVINGILPVLQEELFEFAAVRIIGCASDHTPYESANWYRVGHAPDRARVLDGGVSVAYDDSIAEPIALAVAKSLADGDDSSKKIRASLEQQTDGYRFTIFVDAGPEDEEWVALKQVGPFIGRQVFDAIPDAELLRCRYVDIQNQPVVSHEILEGLGTEIRLGRNRFFHDASISADDIAAVQQGLKECGVYTEESSSAIRVKAEFDGQLAVQIVFFSETPDSLGEEEIESLEKELRRTSLWGLGHRIEFVDFDFQAHPNLSWNTRLK